MIWKILAVLIAAIALIYLGQLTVLVSVLALGVKALLAVLVAVVVCGLGMVLWQQYRKTRRDSNPRRLIFKKQ